MTILHICWHGPNAEEIVFIDHLFFNFRMINFFISWSIVAREGSHLAFLAWLLFELIFLPKIFFETSFIILLISKRSIPTELINFFISNVFDSSIGDTVHNCIEFVLLETNFLPNSPISNVFIDEIHFDAYLCPRNVSVANHYSGAFHIFFSYLLKIYKFILNKISWYILKCKNKFSHLSFSD